MSLAKVINGKRYEMMRAFKYKKDANKLAIDLRKKGNLVRIIHQKQYVNLRGEEKRFWAVFAQNK